MAKTSKPIRFTLVSLFIAVLMIAAVLAGYRAGFRTGYSEGDKKVVSEIPRLKAYYVHDLLPADGDREAKLQKLLGEVVSNSQPESWEALGGEYFITTDGMPGSETLIVYQTGKAHDEIRAYLKSFRAEHGLPDSTQLTHTYGQSFDAPRPPRPPAKRQSRNSRRPAN